MIHGRFLASFAVRLFLTNAEQQANAFTAQEAEKQRAWEEEMSSTAYQRQVAGYACCRYQSRACNV